MKRFISITLLTLILVASSRLTISAHFCGGDLVSLEFYKVKKGCGKCGSTTQKHPCCKDVTSTIAPDDFNSRTVDFDFFHTVVALPETSFEIELLAPISLVVNKHSVEGNAPPFVVKEPRYILFRSLIV